MEETRCFEPGEDSGACAEERPEILEEIAVEELAIDGICGVY